jgi:hypothetical protein
VHRRQTLTRTSIPFSLYSILYIQKYLDLVLYCIGTFSRLLSVSCLFHTSIKNCSFSLLTPISSFLVSSFGDIFSFRFSILNVNVNPKCQPNLSVLIQKFHYNILVVDSHHSFIITSVHQYISTSLGIFIISIEPHTTHDTQI